MNDNTTQKGNRLPRWVAPTVFFLLVAVVALVAMLGTSIVERRWEAARPEVVVKPVKPFEPDSSVWGENYPREYERWRMTEDSTTKTKYGGSFPRDYLEEDPDLVVLWAGYTFSKDYKQARGHFHAIDDVTETKRLKKPKNPGTCWTCKSPDVPRLMDTMGPAKFYSTDFYDLKDQITHPIGCADCHDPATMKLTITRPALREAFAAQGKDIDKATHQEMRSLVCAQCHVEYYFQKEPKDYLKFPWDGGTDIDAVIAYYDKVDHTDFVHAISKVKVLKAQHPDYELYGKGIHAYRGVACADCHMPYRTEGGVKFTDHMVRSPLENVANSCSVCHRWSEQEITDRVNAIQDRVYEARRTVEDALVKAHLDIAAAMQAGVPDAALEPARTLVRHGQFRWDFVAASNGMGFHAPQEVTRILLKATDEAEKARLLVARLLAAKGISVEPSYPPYASRAAAYSLDELFIEGKTPNLFSPPPEPQKEAADAGVAKQEI
jgi:nitrite reductase (cytochrome c-552)